MKIKTLPFLVFSLCSSIPCQSFGQLFSVNAVGYEDVILYAGINYFGNPLNAGNNSVSNVLRGLPNGSYLVSWDAPAQTFGPTNTYYEATGWTKPEAILDGINGVLLWLPATKTNSFAGEFWALPCVTFRVGASLLSIMPDRGCGFCDNINGDCPAPITDGTVLTKWRASTQEGQMFEYIQDFGWAAWNIEVPFNPTLEPGDAAWFSVPSGFNARSARPSLPAPLFAWWAPTRLLPWSRNGTNFTMCFGVSNSVSYWLLSCTNLSERNWRVTPQTINPTNGIATCSIGAPTNGSVFYRLCPAFSSPAPVMTGASRQGTQFHFEFYASTNAAYEVQRATNAATGPWQTIRTITAESNTVVSVTDTNAPRPRNYYRLRY